MRFVGSGRLRKAIGRPGDELNVFVQVHQGGDIVPRRGRITENMVRGIQALDEVQSDRETPCAAAALGHFIRTSLESGVSQSAEIQSITRWLVLWGGTRTTSPSARTPTTDGMIDALDFAELARSARAFAAPVRCRCEARHSRLRCVRISRRWRWRVSSSRSPNTSSARRSAFRCLAGRTTESSIAFEGRYGRLMEGSEFRVLHRAAILRIVRPGIRGRRP
jgi:hypothetical protein